MSRDEPVKRPLPVRIAQWVSSSVAFVGALLGVVFVLFPALKPEGEAPVRNATLSDLTYEKLSWGSYLDRESVDATQFPDSMLRRRGVLVGFDATIEGYKKRDLPLRWQLVDARSGVQLDESKDYRLESLSAKDGGHPAVWVPLPSRRSGHVRVLVELFEDSGRDPIDTLETPPIRLS